MTAAAARTDNVLPCNDIPFLRRVTKAIQAVGGINLGQGTCQLPVPPFVIDAAARALKEGVNRYTPPQGLLEARQAIAKKLRDFNGIVADPETEVAITPGVTGAFDAVCHVLLHRGDEVVSFEPYYPYHHNALVRAGATVRYVRLAPPDWSFSRAELENAISPRTKFILLNTPSNPCGKVFTASEIEAIGKVCAARKIYLVTDEMYEYMTFDGRRHVSPAALPGLWDRTITMGGYSKTFAITGWRIGYLAAPKSVTEQLSKALDALYICAPSPLQKAVASAVDEAPASFYSELQSTYDRKRQYFTRALSELGFEAPSPQGAYYVVAAYDKRFGSMDSVHFVNTLIAKCRVGAVPSNDFVLNPGDNHWVRFCIAVDDSVLEQAVEFLGKGLSGPLR